MSTTSPFRPGARRRTNPSIVLGVFLIAAGLLLLLDRADVLDAGAWVADWSPALLVALGVWLAFSGMRLGGAMAIVAGLLLLGAVHDVVDVDLVGLIWPSVLVVLGAGALASGARVRRAVASAPTSHDAPVWQSAPTATAVFGDARLSISDDGSDRAAVTAVSVFGDVQVSVPPGWRVVDRSTALLGSVKIPRDQPSYAEAPVLELHGLAIFGDTRVRYHDAASA